MKRLLILFLFMPSTVFAGGQLSRYSFGKDRVVGLWHFNENGGTAVADASGNGNTGTFAGNMVWTTGKIAGGVATGGAGDSSISFANESNFDFQFTTPFYIVAYFKVGGDPLHNDVMLGKCTSINTNPGYIFGRTFTSPRDLQWEVKTNDTNRCRYRITSVVTPNSPIDGKWHTLIAWWNATGACVGGGGFYIDGAVPSGINVDGTYPTTTILNNVPFGIGEPNTADQGIRSTSFDEVAVVQGSMTDQKAKRIHALFNNKYHTGE